MNSSEPQHYFVFDVESVGLHGAAFAYGFVIIDELGNQKFRKMVYCPLERAHGLPNDRDWVQENVVPALSVLPGGGKLDIVYDYNDVIKSFWQDWQEAKASYPGIRMAADVAWPVEARLLSLCVDQDVEGRAWEGPYPLIDIASVRLGAGFDPLATESRLPDELPVHNPLADAAQSARLLTEALSLGPLSWS